MSVSGWNRSASPGNRDGYEQVNRWEVEVHKYPYVSIAKPGMFCSELGWPHECVSHPVCQVKVKRMGGS
jgi:hypothetical protein